MKELLVAKVFLQNANDEILLLRRSHTAPRRALEWDLPGGWVEPGEDPLQAAIRELEEEAGVKLDSVTEAYHQVDERDDQIIIRHYVIGLSDHPEVTLSYEHDIYRWVTKGDFLSVMNYDPHVTAFKNIYKQ